MYSLRSRGFSRPIRTAAILGLTALLAASSACSDTFRGVSTGPAEQLFEAITVRFSPNSFDSRYNSARVKLAQSALVPSRIFNDTSVWIARPSPAIRQLHISGSLGADARYHLDARSLLAPPARPGETRHVIALEQISSNQFRWDTRVDLALGAVTADEIAAALGALLRAPEGRSEKELRDDYRTAFPRATAMFGRGFSLDSVHVAPAALGATSVTLRFAFHPELMKATNPSLAGYLDKYLGPAKYHFILADRGGVVMFDIVGKDRAMTLRYRVQQGALVSLLGPPRPWPDTLQLTTDVSLKVKMFTVGFHRLVTDFEISNGTAGAAHERAWTITARREPEWDLPMLTERLIRSPLHRPFEGQGVMFRMAVRDSAGAQSLFVRRTRLDVQESAIMKFLGSLASNAVGDLDDRVEIEEHRYLRDGFLALQADLRAIAPRCCRN